MSIIGAEEQRPVLSRDAHIEMERFGIVRVAADSFCYREFRYTNLQDALAQAKRDAEGGQRVRAWAASR